MKILIGSNIFGNNRRQDIAIQSWIHLQKNHLDIIDLIAIQFEDGKPEVGFNFQEYQDFKMKTKFSLKRSSKDLDIASTKKLPFINDILNDIHEEAMLRDDITHFAFVNSDCILTVNVINYALKNNINALAVSRVDIEDNITTFGEVLKKSVNILRSEIAGFDFFIFEKHWFAEHKKYFRDYLLGIARFDPIYAGIIKIMGGEIYNDAANPMVCHIMHPTVSNGNDVENQYNVQQMKSSDFDHLVMNMMFYHLQYNLCRSTPWGAFLKPDPNQDKFSKDYFDIMGFSKENNVKHISML